MLSIGRIFAGDGWRYLWEQVAVGAEDYYLADVARGETQGRWCGTAARPELGLAGEVTNEHMHRVFGLLVHPSEDVELGRAPRIYRSLDQRLSAARQVHDEAQQQAWDLRAVELAEARASMERIEGERRAHQAAATETWAEREAVIRRGGERHAVAGFDLCFSPPKSMSVLWAAADKAGRETIWRAQREGVRAALGYLEREAAWSRSGYNGIRQIDTTGWVIAAFEHRMSRAGDVQLHTHSAVLNRARCPDGEWRSLDGRAVYRVAASAGALYDRVREAALERDLGVRHESRKPGGPREIVGVDEDVCRLFSSRRAAVEGRVTELVSAYRARSDGAAPSQWTLTQMSRWATLETRQRNKRSEGTPEALARWEAETRAQLGRSLTRVWKRAIHRQLNNQHGGAANGRHPAQQQTPSDEELVAAAVGTLDASKSTWTRYDLARQLTLTLPADRSRDPEGLLGRVDQLVERALGEAAEKLNVIDLSASPVFDTPTELRRHKDGQSVYSEHGATRYSTRAALAKERAALETARRGDGPRLDQTVVEAVLGAAHLGDDQAEAVGRLATSGRPIEALVGPAGTGKTSTMRALAATWRADGRAVIGLAVSETATRVLGRQADIRVANTAKLLYEHTHRHPRTRGQRWWRDQYGIPPGSLVILDEASMASRDEIDQLRGLCQQHDAKLLLVGDHQQLASPSAGGLFRLLVEQVGALELDQVHRFVNRWETDASLALRASDPGVLAEYDLRGRIHGGSEAEMEDAAFTAALADRARGVRTFLLADTNETAARLAGRTRDQLVAAGAVDDARTVELADENRAGRGDQIVTRDNDRTNRSDRGHFVANRDTWQITSVQPDGTLAVSRVDPDRGQLRPDDTTVLDAAYVAEHVQLAYAGTVHAAQGATGATTHAIITANTTRAALHVALTHGRDENHAYVVCARPEGADRDGPTQDPLAVLAAILERDDAPDERAAVAVQAQAAEHARSLKTLFPVWQDLIATAGRPRWQTAITHACGPELAEEMLASPVWSTLAARLGVLDAAGIDSPTALACAARRRDFDDADDIAAVLHWRLSGAETNARLLVGDTFGELSPGFGGEMERAVTQVAAAMDARTDALSEQAEIERPAWAAQLGPLPDHPKQREDWRRRAGIVAGYREAFDVRSDGPDPIGSSPPVGRPDARAWWQRAAAALDRSEPATLARSPDERLEAIVEQSRAANRSAPDAMADRLRELHRSLREAHTAEGVARHAGAITASQAAARAAETLARAVVETETAHQRRKSWVAATARLRQHCEVAQAELDLRHEANAGTSTASTSLPALRQRAAHAKARLDSMEETLRRAQDLKDRCDEEIARLNTKLVLLLTTRPATTTAASAIAAEHRVADQIDRLRAALNHRRFGLNALRGSDRDTLQTELDRLVRTHPPLASAHLRDLRWQHIRTEGNDVDDRAVGHYRTQIADQQGRRDQHAAIAQACQTERDSRASAYDKLAAALEKRTSPSRHDSRDDIVHSRRGAATPADQSRAENHPGLDRPTPLKHDIDPPSIDRPSQAGPSLEP